MKCVCVGGGCIVLHCCGLPSPELNLLMPCRKFMIEGKHERGQKEMKENKWGKQKKLTEFKREKIGIDRWTLSRKRNHGKGGNLEPLKWGEIREDGQRAM